MNARKAAIYVAKIIIAAAVAWCIIWRDGSILFGEGSSLLYRTAGYAVIFAVIATAALVTALAVKGVLLAASKLRRKNISTPFSLLFAGGNALILLFSLCIMLKDQLSDHNEAIIDFHGWGSVIMGVTLIPVTIIYIVLSLSAYFRKKRKTRNCAE